MLLPKEEDQHKGYGGWFARSCSRLGARELSRFRQVVYASLTARADALFELTDAVQCADGPVTSLVELTNPGGRAPARARRDI
jgi:hypothetical protein